MTRSTRALMALIVASAMMNSFACGDDQDDDLGADGSDGSDGDGVGGMDGDGVGDGDDQPVVMDACPAHPAVTDQGAVCVITAPQGSPITTDLTLAPVKGKEGYLLMDGVWVGEDVGAGAEPDPSKKSATLTIKPGTQIFGASTLSFLLIQRGSKIDAQGTKDAPVVFTSGAEAPVGPGDWGGLVINGRAPSNAGNDVMGEAGTGSYGGPDGDDSSGVLKYVRVEFGGGKVDSTNELNGIAFQGVGSGTEVDYVQVHANDDDGVEFFGGAVNVKHLVITHVGDDAIDWTFGWKGNVQYALVEQRKDYGENGIEADNNEDNNDATPISSPTLSNLTFLGSKDSATSNHGALLRRGTQAHIHNALILDFAQSCLSVDGDVSASFAGDELNVKNSRISCPTLYQETNGTTTRDMFEADANGNEVLDGSDVLDGYLPKADSGLLMGGAVPDGEWFEDADYIGAFKDVDWTAGWVATPEFAAPADS